ncbi:MAG: hypothetical protein U0K87_12320 [Ruminococcus sp.]|nr:hypothetical protein [Ruminococcus sp.]
MGIEVDNITEIIVVKMQIGIDTKPCHQHIGYAVFHELTIHNVNCVLAQAFKKTIVNRSQKIADIVGRVVLNSVVGGADDRLLDTVLAVQVAKGVFKRINDLALIFGAHIPNGNRS